LSVQTSKCPECGSDAEPGDRFCADCGAPLDAKVRAPAPAALGKLGRNRNMRWLIAGAVVLVGLFAFIAFLYFNAPERRPVQAVGKVTADPATIGGLAFLPGQPTIVFLAGAAGLYASPDDGGQWSPPMVPGQLTAITTSTAQPLNVYTAGAHIFVRSNDGGRSFSRATGGIADQDILAMAASPEDGKLIFAINTSRELLQSTDGGDTWSRIAANTPARIRSLTMTGGQAPTIYAATLDQGILQTTNGTSWFNANGAVNGAMPTSAVASIAFDAGSGDRYVAPNGDTVTGALYAGTDRGLFKSIDGGGSWAPLPLKLPLVAIAVSRGAPGLIMAVDSQGNVYRSADRGVTWGK
jgi:photosystem II stability/assembly factor-like uncharacterized protein